MRITAGSLRGRHIPFNAKKFGNAEVTPQKLKGALFSILGESLEGRVFLDLFSCSGQVGLEAVSRGCRLVVFNERDRRRFEFIRSIVKEWGLEDAARVLHMKASACLQYVSARGELFDYIFLDPPYRKDRGDAALYHELLEELSEYPLLRGGGVVIVQHYAQNVLREASGAFLLAERRVYGTSGLAFYRRKEQN
jgi:16S rRNA (guanine(966)-N(2))-methyltransferase RsmD